MRKQTLLAEFSRTLWAMDPDYLATFSSVLRRWADGLPASPEIMADIRSAQAARDARQKSAANVGGGIAVLPLFGVITQRASMVNDVSGAGGTSTQRFSQAFRDAMADTAVGGIIIEMDTPGGSVNGTGELHAEIMKARGKKPVIGYVNSLSASAGYWIGSACDEVFSTTSGETGSIGVYATHTDVSRAMENEGIRQEFISAGKYKVEGNSLGPLSAEARAFMQSRIDAFYTAFTSDIARARGVKVGAVRNGMGEGRCLGAADALAERMIDGICTMDEVIARLQSRIKTGGRPQAYSMPSRPQAAFGRASITAANRRREIEIASLDLASRTSTKPSRITDTTAAAAHRRRELQLASLS